MSPFSSERLVHIARQHADAGRVSEAEGLCRQALKQQPDSGEAFALLGLLQCRAKRYDRAIEFLKRAIAIDENVAEFHCNLGVALGGRGDSEQAIAAHRRAIELQPDRAELHANLGSALASAQRWDEAIAAYQASIRLKPSFADAHYNLANALRSIEQFGQAAVEYREAIRCNPDFAEAYSNLGVVLRSQGRLDEAIASYDKAIELIPDSPEAHWNRAVALLLAGDYVRGWPEYEWRHRQSWAKSISFQQPRWLGEDLAGRTILLYAEQGLGDTIQFVRYVPLVAAQCAKVILACQPELRDLLGDLAGVWQIVTNGEAVPPFDLQSPLMSLPAAFGTQLDSIPNQVPYLSADSRLIEKWASRLTRDGGSLRVGIAWAGRPEHQSDRQRSISLADLLPLTEGSQAIFYILQRGPAAAQRLTPPAGMRLIDLTTELTTFAQTAVLIHHLDLVVSVDTAVAHLAAAMGKPVWLFVPFVPDWRWMLNRADSPWYPTMRLFRQQRAGQWADPIHRAALALRSFSPQVALAR